MTEKNGRKAIQPNTRVQGFEFREELGRGGFGITYKGRDMGLETLVAIKEYFPKDSAVRKQNLSVVAKSSEDKEDLKWGLGLFYRQAEAMAKVMRECLHPNVIQFQRVFRAHGTAYIVMEYVEGETLGEFLERRGLLMEQGLREILFPLLEGLSTVHAKGILHRDIKPGTIMLREKSRSPVLVDFGLAREMVDADSPDTAPIVTLGYSPIEQYYGDRKRQGGWTDIYALGVVCYRSLVGKAPVRADKRAYVIERGDQDPLESAVQAAHGRAEAGFLEAIDWALRVKPEDRPQSLEEWREALEGRVSEKQEERREEHPTPMAQEEPTNDADMSERSIQRQALPSGTQVQGFEFREELGRGGFGITYKGWDVGLDTSVAIKEYFPKDSAVRKQNGEVVAKSSEEKEDFESGLERFKREAQSMEKVTRERLHPNVVQVRHIFPGHGTAYIVMEYVEGETLGEFLENQGRLTEQGLREILFPLLEGLSTVHAKEILHRDIKPGTIMLREKSRSPVLVDFGLAREMVVDADSRHTVPAVTLGYSPIEQHYGDSKSQGAWTDIYALGAVCYWSLVGKVPVSADKRAYAIEREDQDPLESAVQAAHGRAEAGFLKAIDWALRVKPEDRPQSLEKWREALESRVSEKREERREGHPTPTAQEEPTTVIGESQESQESDTTQVRGSRRRSR